MTRIEVVAVKYEPAVDETERMKRILQLLLNSSPNGAKNTRKRKEAARFKNEGFKKDS